MTREDLDLEREQKCEAIGDVVAAVIPPPAPGTQALPPESVALAMTRQPRPRLRAAWRWGVPAMAAAAVVLAVAFPKLLPSLKRDRPLNYELTGSFATHDDGFETPPAAGATARFSDGTSIAVGARSAARIKARTRAGATVQLDRGHASFAVVHRPGADWHVEVGPYDIAVTGTEFDVRWSDNRDRFEVLMKSGSIVVRGALTGAGIPLRTGQRLVASLSQKTLVVDEITPEPSQPDPTPAAPAVAPSDEPAREEPPRVRRERALPPPAAPERPRGQSLSSLQPPPFEPAPLPPAAPPPPSPLPDALPPATAALLNQGGAACGSKPLPQIRFEHVNEGFRVLGNGPASVFSNPVIDHTHSWCGGGALRFDASFDNSPPRAPGEVAARTGEAVVYLPRTVDMRGRTVTLRILVKGAYGTEFSARILAGQGDLRTGNSVNPHLTTDQWWTISATFHDRPPGFGMPPSQISNVDRLILKIDVTGDYKVWSGLVYIDDISWR